MPYPPEPHFILSKFESDNSVDASSSVSPRTMRDWTVYVTSLDIKDEMLDSSDSGRDTSTGLMDRTVIAHKYTVTVKFRRMRESTVQVLRSYVYNDAKDKDGTTKTDTDGTAIKHRYFYICLRLPHVSDYNDTTHRWSKIKVYCATINYGSQRYDRMEQEIYYDGMTMTCVQM